MKTNIILYVLLGTLMMLLLGIVYSYSVFRLEIDVIYATTELVSGLPYMISLFFYALFMAIGGRLLQRYSTLAISLTGMVLISVGFILASFTDSIVGIMLTYGILIGSGVGLLYGLPLRIISQLNHPKSGLLTGITLMGFGLSPLLFAPIIQELITTQGLNQTFLLLGLANIVLLTALIIPLSNRDIPKDKSLSFTYDALRQPRFYIIYSLFFIGTLIGLTIIGFTNIIGVKLMGITPLRMAFYLGLFSILNGIGRPLFGYLNDHIGFIRSATISFLSLAVAAFGFYLFSDSLIIFFLAFFLIYINFGGWLSLAPSATHKHFNKANYSQNYGLMFTAYGLGALLGGAFGGYIVDQFSYQTMFLSIGFLALLGFLIVRLTKSYLQE